MSRTGTVPSDETWLVVVSSEVRAMTSDQLDGAFRRGEVDAGTAVWTAGMATWEPLGVVASLEDGRPLESKQSRSIPVDSERPSLPGPGTPGDANAALWVSLAPVPQITRVRRRVSKWSAFVARLMLRAPGPNPAVWGQSVRRRRRWSWVPVIAGCVALGALCGWSVGSKLLSERGQELSGSGLRAPGSGR